MNNERFTVPEILFSPSNIGKPNTPVLRYETTSAHPNNQFNRNLPSRDCRNNCAGCELCSKRLIDMLHPPKINHNHNKTHLELHPLFYSNVIVIGGNARIPGFQRRLYELSCHIRESERCGSVGAKKLIWFPNIRESELRRMVSEDFAVNMTIPERFFPLPFFFPL